MAEVIGAVIHVLGPSLVDVIKRQFPEKVEQKWNQRVYDISGKVHDATKEGLDLDPHVLNEFLESAQLYREITQELHELNEARDAGDWNYLKRRSLSKAICRHGRITLNLGLSTSTVIRQQVLCKTARHRLTCNRCPGSKLSCDEAGHTLTCDKCFPEDNHYGPQTAVASAQTAAASPPSAIVLPHTAIVLPLLRITTEEALHPVWD